MKLIQIKLRSLNQQRQRIAKMEKGLHAEARAKRVLAEKLPTLVKRSGLTPRDLVFALVEQFRVRLAGRRKGQRPPRKRTKITPELRDAVKKAVAAGQSMNRTSKEFDLSYIVVVKMVRGGYDGLK